MKYTAVSESAWFVRLEKDEQMLEQLTDFVRTNKIQAGFVQAIGGLQTVRLAVYRLSGSKEYEAKDFSGDLELVSMTGNIAVNENEPALHLHAVVGNEKLEVVAGHFVDAVVGGTVEVYITSFRAQFHRQTDAATGLKLLEFVSGA